MGPEQGEAVTSGLKKVTADMKTKNMPNRGGSVPAREAPTAPSPAGWPWLPHHHAALAWETSIHLAASDGLLLTMPTHKNASLSADSYCDISLVNTQILSSHHMDFAHLLKLFRSAP